MGIERRAGADRRTDGTTVLPSATSSGISRSSRDYDDRMEAMRDRADRPASLVTPGLLCGIGLGGLLDGILFHRLLNWHHLISDNTPMTGDGITDNLRADGYFDLAAFAVLLIGMAMMWTTASNLRRIDREGAGTRLVGWMLVGWAAFNIVEGALFHFILGAHHVNETTGANEAAWDWGFLIASVVIGLIGLAMTRTRREDTTKRRDRSTLPDVPPGRM